MHNTVTTSLNNLAQYFAAGCKPLGNRRIGFEREVIGVTADSHNPLSYNGSVGIESLLHEMAQKGDWQKTFEKENIIALNREGTSITLEPGGQVELSTAPAQKVHELAAELARWQQEIRNYSQAQHISWLFTGMNPLYTPENVHWMPKGRYQIMRQRFQNTGDLGHYMMALTTSLQVSVDYEDESDCSEKFRTAMKLAPIFTAMYANSPFRAAKKTEFVSFRANVWENTDPARCGIPKFVFDDQPLWQAYRDYALNVPMFFLASHSDELVEAPQENFSQWMKKNTHINDDELLRQWKLHLSTIFTEVRLKHFIEIRCADGNKCDIALSFPALCVALMYNKDARTAAHNIIKFADHKMCLQAQNSAARHGLSKATYGKYQTIDLAKELLDIAQSSLQTLDKSALKYLEPMAEQVLERKCSPGEELIRMWDGAWQQQPAKLISYLGQEPLESC